MQNNQDNLAYEKQQNNSIKVNNIAAIASLLFQGRPNGIYYQSPFQINDIRAMNSQDFRYLLVSSFIPLLCGVIFLFISILASSAFNLIGKL